MIDQSDAWRLFTKRTDRATARTRIPALRIEGDVVRGERVLEMFFIMEYRDGQPEPGHGRGREAAG